MSLNNHVGMLMRTQRAALAQADHPWALLLGSLAVVARHDPRPRVADAAAQALLEVMQDNCQDWDASSWRTSYERAVSYLFELPTPSEETAPASETAAVSQQSQVCPPFSKRIFPPHRQL